VRATAAQRERLAADAHRLETERAQAEEQLSALQAQAATLNGKRDDLLDKLRAAEEVQDAAGGVQREAEERLAGLRAEIADLSAARTRATHDLARLDEREGALRAQASAHEARRSALAARAAELTAAAGQMEAAIGALLAERDAGAERFSRLQGEQSELGQRLASCDEDVRQIQADRQVVARTLGFLEDMHRRLEGYEQGVREILIAKQEHPERFAGIRYPILELLRVAAPHRAAIEAALGRRLFSLVAGSVDDVKGGLSYLRGNGQGSASFIPVELVSSRPSVELPSGTGIVGRATDLVELTNGARDVVQVLLADVVVVSSLDDAVALRAQGFTGRIATLDGELLTPDGVISFRGKPDGEALLLGRREQIASLRERAAGLDASAERVASQRTALADQLAALIEQCAAMEAECSRLDETIAQQQAALAPVQVELARLPLDQGDVDAALARIAGEHERVRSEVDRLRADDAELAQVLAEREAAVEALETEVHSVVAQTQAARARLTDARVELAEVAGTLEGLRERVDEYERREAELSARCDQLQGEMTVLDGEHHLLTHSLEEATQARTLLAEQQEATRTLLGALEEERGLLQQRLVDLEAAWRQVQESLRDVEEQAHRLEVRHAQVDTEFSGATRRISAEFGVAWENVRELRLPVGRDEAQGRIEALRGLLAALGPVNLRAVDEHAAVAARVGALRTHAEDLDRARAALGALIRHLDDVLRVRFAETFEAVNEEFNRLFVRLFAGGRARLLLVDGEPGSEPGIEIEAQLPGKKMRSLSALSGGERVLVALSLIFAMLRVHPSPFCIFDEVEAALDDANTTKFTTLLRELAERTQVLIITHNKGTMEAADVLYGVTMEIPGVSKIISMRLTKKGIPEPVPVA